jgi:hypothetical protein
MRFAAWYGIVVGILMLAQWSFFLATGQVPEVQTEPVRLAFHLAAEGITALGLLVSGLALLRNETWARASLLVFLGLVIYSEIVSPGYFAQQGQWALVAMFAVLLLGAILSVFGLARKSRQ